jgi:hypothetical protein
MPQTSINFRQGLAFEGQIATSAPRILDGVVQGYENGMAGKLPFGRVVVVNPSDTTGKGLILPTAAAATQPPLGVTFLNEEWGLPFSDLLRAPTVAYGSNPAPIAENEIGYPQGTNVLVGVMTVGDVWMITEEAVVPGDPVFYRYASGAAGTVLGRVRKTNVTNETSSLPGARFHRVAAANSLVIVRLGTPGNL